VSSAADTLEVLARYADLIADGAVIEIVDVNLQHSLRMCALSEISSLIDQIGPGHVSVCRYFVRMARMVTTGYRSAAELRADAGLVRDVERLIAADKEAVKNLS
jgi:hypothetical protein